MNFIIISFGVLKWSDPFEVGNQFSSKVITSSIKLAAITLGPKLSQIYVDRVYLGAILFFC